MSIFASLRPFVVPTVLGLVAGVSHAVPRAAAAQKVQGKVSGFANLERDNWADLAIVFPTLTEEQILSFDFASMLSPNEPMKAGPLETEVPGNVFVPEQRERYGFIPVTLKKDSFTLMMEPGVPQELFVLTMRAPFSPLVDKARKKAPTPELLKLVQFGQLGFFESRDWSLESSVDLPLNQTRPLLTNLNWSRGPATANESDLVVNFEETPTQRWLVSDIDTVPKPVVTVKSTSFTGLAKLLAARVQFSADGRDLETMRAWFPTYLRGEAVTVAEVPALVGDVKWASPGLLTWSPGDKRGWVTVLRADSLNRSTQPDVDTSNVFFPDLSHLVDIVRPRTSAVWVRVEDAQLAFDAAALAGSRLVFIFLGGDDLAAGPSIGGASELQVQNVTP